MDNSSSNKRAKVNARVASIDAALSNGLNNPPSANFLSNIDRQGACFSRHLLIDRFTELSCGDLIDSDTKRF